MAKHDKKQMQRRRLWIFLNGNMTEVHMEQGPIGRTLLVFAAPILLSQILQQMYSIADCMIVGHFGGGNGLAAAGEAALILSVIINFFVGFSTGVSAITAVCLWRVSV